MTYITKSILTFILLALVGCASAPIIKYRNIYITKKVPIIYVPSPPKVIRPVLYTTTLPNKSSSIGILVKAYYIDTIQLLQYSKKLEFIINKYTELAKNNPKLPPLTISTPHKK